MNHSIKLRSIVVHTAHKSTATKATEKNFILSNVNRLVSSVIQKLLGFETLPIFYTIYSSFSTFFESDDIDWRKFQFVIT